MRPGWHSPTHVPFANITYRCTIKTSRGRFSCFSATLFIARSFALISSRVWSFESAVYWLIKSNHRELARHLHSTYRGLQISCLVSLSRLLLRNIQRSARIALGRSRIRGLDMWMDACVYVLVRCLDVSWLADDADAWWFAANRLTSKREAASWYPSWNLNINSVSNVERVWIHL